MNADPRELSATEVARRAYEKVCGLPPEGDPFLKAGIKRAEKKKSESLAVLARGTFAVDKMEMSALANAIITALSVDAAGEIFQRAHFLVRVVQDGRPSRGVRRPPGAWSIETIPAAALRERMADCGTFTVTRKKKVYRVLPPTWLVDTALARGSWPFPYLEGITESPTMRPDGSILDRAGYDPATGYLYLPGATFPRVPESPTLEDARESLAVIADIFTDFPFRDATGLPAALSLILTLAVRAAIDGPCPLYAWRSPSPGTGKGLGADVAAVMVTGRAFARMGYSDRDDELRKSILAIAQAGDQGALLDNLTGRVGSRSLAAALTAREWTDRYLGESRMVTAPLSVVWCATGNNLSFRGDLGRRVVPIDLDAGVEHPEDRADFKHTNLIEHVQEHRAELLVHALTVARAYHVAGRPSHGLPRKGSFEAWDDLIRGAVIWVGAGDPDAGKERIREDSDSDLVSLAAVLELAEITFAEREFTARAFLDAGELDAPLRDAISEWATDSKGRLNVATIGRKLRDNRDRIAGGRRFIVSREARKGNTWRVERTNCARGESGNVGE